MLLSGQRLADGRMTKLLSFDLRQPPSHRNLSDLHVSADLHNAQALPADHLNDLQLEACVKDSSFRLRHVSRPGDFHLCVCQSIESGHRLSVGGLSQQFPFRLIEERMP